MPYIFNKYYPFRNIVFFIGESVLIFFSMLLVMLIYKGYAILLLEIPESFQQALLVTAVFQLCLYFFDLYELRSDLSMPETSTKITQAFGVGCIVLGAVYYFLPKVIISTRIFWSGYITTYILILIWRFCYYYILKRRLFVQSILILGTGRLANDIAREVEGRYDSPYRTIAFIGSSPPAYNPRKANLFKDLSMIRGQWFENKIDQIVIALDDRRGTMPIETLLYYKLRGVSIVQGVNFYERLTGKILVESVNPSWIIFSDGFSTNKIMAFIKRCFDVFMSSLLIIFTAPIMLLSALVIRLESKGPILYFQERVGKGRKTFKIVKFRSMVQDAEKNGAVWAASNDSRVTRFGSFMRKTRIDELPQLYNVLRGEMSFVGPRPERPVFVDQLTKIIPYYDIRHDVRPGVTGWAQVCYPYGASEEDALRKLEYDLYYMKNISIPLDILVVFRTIKTVLFAKGSR